MKLSSLDKISQLIDAIITQDLLISLKLKSHLINYMFASKKLMRLNDLHNFNLF